MKKHLIFLFIIQSMLFIPQVSIAKTSGYSLDQQIMEKSFKIFPKKKIHRLTKKKTDKTKKLKGSIILFYLSAFCIILGIASAGNLVFIFLGLGLLFALLGVFVGLKDWKKHRNPLDGLGFILNLGVSILFILFSLIILVF